MNISGYIAERGVQLYSIFLDKTYQLISNMGSEISSGMIESRILAQHPFIVTSLWVAYKLKIPESIKKISGKISFKTIKNNSKAAGRDLEGML